MKTVVINEKQTGIKFKNGRFDSVLASGKYTIFGNANVEILDNESELKSAYANIEDLVARREIEAVVDKVFVGDTELALRFRNGNYVGVLEKGMHAFFKKGGRNDFRIVKVTTEEITDIPTYILDRISGTLIQRISVPANYKGVLYVGGKFIRVLDSGNYYFWRTGEAVMVSLADTRILSMNIQGQEILTADKVPVRFNFVLDYRITDPAGMYENVTNLDTQMHQIAQMAIREIVGRQRLDSILEDKDEVTRYVFDRMKSKCSEFYVDILDAGVKDVILPGNIRDIMNTVLIAEKRAQANVITRREEVASTRSLLNTAKLMEENPTLYKLKELEYVERICENVGNINLNGSGDILAQLTGMLTKETK